MDTTEITFEAEKQLHDNLRKCRFCFRMIIDERKAVEISDEIRLHFVAVTQMQLLDSDIFSSRICQMCEADLKVFINFQSDLIDKQKTLYDLAGLQESHYTNKSQQFEVVDEFYETHNETANDTEGFIEEEEVIEEDVDLETLEFEAYENSNQEELSSQGDDGDESRVSMKIEKIDETTSQDEDKSDEVMDEFEDGEQIEIAEAANFSHLLVCQPCQIEVPENQLELHIKLVHKPSACPVCAVKFETKILCKNHIARHHAPTKGRRKRKHFCHICAKDYENRRQLEDHVRSYHEKERNEECEVCHKKFFYRDLKKHIDHVHGEKTISCEFCEKKYSCIENLRLHMRYHNEPKFKCHHQGCGKKFHQKILLHHHLLKHTKEKPFYCEACEQSFFSLRDLRRHNERVHNKIMRKCLLCEAEFGRKDKLRSHVIQKHKELTESEKSEILEQVKLMKWKEGV